MQARVVRVRRTGTSVHRRKGSVSEKEQPDQNDDRDPRKRIRYN
jgi:hypothetical protein